MCRSKAEGGQRCFSHALKSYEAARDKALLTAQDGPDTVDSRVAQVAAGWDHPSLHQERVLLASTKQGRALLAEWRSPGDNPDRRALDAMWGGDNTAVNEYLDRVAAQGKKTAKINETVRRLGVSRVARFRDRAAALIEDFTLRWRFNASLVSSAGVSGYKAYAAQSNLNTAIYLSGSALALGALAYSTWRNTRRHTWQESRAHLMETDLPLLATNSGRAERQKVRQSYDRDVALGRVVPPAEYQPRQVPPEAKRAYHRAVRGFVSRFA